MLANHREYICISISVTGHRVYAYSAWVALIQELISDNQIPQVLTYRWV